MLTVSKMSSSSSAKILSSSWMYLEEASGCDVVAIVSELDKLSPPAARSAVSSLSSSGSMLLTAFKKLNCGLALCRFFENLFSENNTFISQHGINFLNCQYTLLNTFKIADKEGGGGG